MLLFLIFAHFEDFTPTLTFVTDSVTIVRKRNPIQKNVKNPKSWRRRRYRHQESDTPAASHAPKKENPLDFIAMITARVYFRSYGFWLYE